MAEQKKEILINLKRFEVNRSQGGVCDYDEPEQWIQSVISDIVRLELNHSQHYNLTLIVSDLLLPAAVDQWRQLGSVAGLSIASQSCHRADVAPGGNFGAFTSLNIASSQARFGSVASLLGHCEERREIASTMVRYAEAAGLPVDSALVNRLTSEIIGEKATQALHQSMRVFLCVGESAEERGDGSFEEQQPRIEQTIRTMLEEGLAGIGQQVTTEQLVIAYEPVWAIGPGKTPPDQAYIRYIAALIKTITMELIGFSAKVVYGGGLKYENASMLAQTDNLDGGLIALTNFTTPIGFNVDELGRILGNYTSSLN